MSNTPPRSRRLLAIYGAALLGVAASVVYLPAQTAPQILTPSPLPDATSGGGYSRFFTSTVSNASYFLVNGFGNLPSGLTLFSNGLLSGTPVINSSVPQTFNFRVAVSFDPPFSKDFSLTVNPPPQPPTSLPVACTGVAYNTPIEVTFGTPSYFVQIPSNQLPPGITLEGPPISTLDASKLALRLAPTGYSLVGTPTQTGTFPLNITVFDNYEVSGNRVVNLNVFNRPTIETTAIPAGVVNQPYSTVLTSNPSAPQNVSFSLQTSNAPFPITVAPNGTVTASPTQAGSFSLLVRAVGQGNCQTNRSYILNVVEQFTITTPTIPNGCEAVPYPTTTLQTAGAIGTVAFTPATNTIPGLSLSASGVITGTPTQGRAQPYTVTAVATDTPPTPAQVAPRQASRTYDVLIFPRIQIAPTSLPNGRVGFTYAPTTISATGGVAPVQLSIPSSALPPGLSFANGVISGTPTQAGTFPVVVTATGQSPCAPATANLTIVIEPGLRITTTALPNGTEGRPYAASLVAVNNVGPTSWAITSGSLPAGLSLNTSTGVISGTPTVIGSSSFSVQVSDNNGPSADPPRPFSITIERDINRGIRITTRSLPNGDTAQDYPAVTLTSEGGSGEIVWSAENLPPGLTLNPVTGVISGRPTVPGTFQVIVRVRDGSSNSDSAVFQVQITGSPVRITTESLATGTVGVQYSQSIAATGGTAPYTFAITSGGLPADLSFANGVISGIPRTAGSTSLTIEATDRNGARGSRSFTLEVRNAAPVITTERLGGAIGIPFSGSIAATGGTAPLRFSAAGLPPELTLNPETGAITGTPTQAGEFSVTATVTDRNNLTGQRSIPLTIAGRLIFTGASLGQRITGDPINIQLSASGGNPNAYVFSQTGGNLPGGLQLTPSGAITGTTTETGEFSFQVRVSDGQQQSEPATFTLSVVERLRITTTSLPAATIGSAYPATTIAAAGGIQPYTFSRVDSANNGLSVSSTGQVTGTFTATANSSITVRVTDQSGQSAEQSLAITANLPPVPTPTITGLPVTPAPNNQAIPGLTIGSAFPLPLNGTFTLSFAPNSTPPNDDPAIVFANNTRTINFTIPTGSTSAQFATPPGFSLGTTAGTITISSVLLSNGVQVGTATQTVVIPRSAPVITAAFATRSGNSINLEVTGFSTTREISGATVRLTAAPGTNLQTTDVTIPIGNAFTQWFSSAQGQSFGSRFTMTVELRVTGDSANAITGIAATLTNAVGSSQPFNVTFR
jgi:large repetitive protein